MKDFILFGILVLVQGLVLAQPPNGIALKKQSMTIEKQNKPDVVPASAILVIDGNNTQFTNDKLTIEHITMEKSYVPDYNIEAKAELTTNPELIKLSERFKPLQSFEMTLERQSEPSMVKPTAVRDDEIKSINTDSKN